MEFRGHLPDAGQRVAGRGGSAFPRRRLAALQSRDYRRAVGVQDRPRAADLGRDAYGAAGERAGPRDAGRGHGRRLMSLDDVRRVADAVLYEGYILYPYRASAQKNRSRWQFGVLMPPAYAAADPSETASLQAECVFEHSGRPTVGVTVRFLHVQRRTGPAGVWDEAVEREVTAAGGGAALFGEGTTTPFGIPGGEDLEATPDGPIVRTRRSLAGVVDVRATELPGPWQAARLTVRVANQTDAGAAAPANREQALPGALVAAHLIITISGGAFLSMTDPPEWAAAGVATCENTGCWPVLAGEAGDHSVVLASPIIL